MKALNRNLPNPNLLFPASSLTYSTFSSGGRGRGRGFIPPSSPPSPPSDSPSHDLPPVGHGRGSGGAIPFTQNFPSFGRGVGRGASVENPPPQKQFVFTPNKSQFDDAPEKSKLDSSVQPAADNQTPKQTYSFTPSKSTSDNPDEKPDFNGFRHLKSLATGRGRGKAPSSEPAPISETNRHARPRLPIGAPVANRTADADAGAPVNRGADTASSPAVKLSREEAIKKAMEVLSRGGPSGPGAASRPSGPVGSIGAAGGRGGRGRGRGMGRGMRGRGRGRGRGRRGDQDDDVELYVGDKADGEKFVKRMEEEKMKLVEQVFEDAAANVLPSPVEDAYLDALHTNNLIEYEPEYLVGFENPDIDDNPPMSIEEVFEKVKPFLMAYEGVKSQEEWEKIIKDLMERLPAMKELIDMYAGSDRVASKQQMQELDRVAQTIPQNVPSSVKRFTDRAVLSLQSNPGWSWARKYQFMDKLTGEISKQYK